VCGECVVRHQLQRHRPREVRLHSAFRVDAGELCDLGFGVLGELTPLEVEVGAFRVGLRADGDVLARCHGQRAGRQARDAGDQDLGPRGVCGGHADDQAGRGHDAIVGAEHRRSKPSDPARSMWFRESRH
jgi:hypothetical protein